MNLYSILPTLDQVQTASKIYDSIMTESKEVYIWWFIFYLRFAVDLLPLYLRNILIKVLMGNGMRTFVGRAKND